MNQHAESAQATKAQSNTAAPIGVHAVPNGFDTLMQEWRWHGHDKTEVDILADDLESLAAFLRHGYHIGSVQASPTVQQLRLLQKLLARLQ